MEEKIRRGDEKLKEIERFKTIKAEESKQRAQEKEKEMEKLR